jgi:hypothetical protein
MRAPETFATAPNGSIVFSDCEAQRVFRLGADGTTHVIAGSGPDGFDAGRFAGDGGPATDARLNCPSGLVFDLQGNLFVADSLNNRVRMIDTHGVITTVAGSGEIGLDHGGYSGDGGPATKALMEFPYGLAFARDGNLLISDHGNDVIRMVDAAGMISTIAGTGHGGFSGDGGPATDAQLHSPWSLVVDGDGNLFVVDQENVRIREIDTHGVISTFAGGGSVGASGQDTSALDVAFTEPYGLALDSAGDLFVSDDLANVIQEIDTQGTVTTIAGTGEAAGAGDGGPAADAQLDTPWGVLFGDDGNLYVADSGNDCIRAIDAGGVITSAVCG